MALNLRHQTAAQFSARFWARVQQARRDGDQIRFAHLIWWLYNRVQAGDFTNNEVRLSFNAAYGRNLNSTQWNSFVTTRLVPIRDRYQEMLNEGDL
jgi:uncharacterized membrane protein